jgi:hypothetical protein
MRGPAWRSPPRRRPSGPPSCASATSRSARCNKFGSSRRAHEISMTYESRPGVFPSIRPRAAGVQEPVRLHAALRNWGAVRPVMPAEAGETVYAADLESADQPAVQSQRTVGRETGRNIPKRTSRRRAWLATNVRSFPIAATRDAARATAPR